MLKNKRAEGIENAGGFLKYTSMAFQMIASILVCVFLGHFLDQKFGVRKSSLDHSISFPLYTFIGTIVGVATSLYLALKSIKK